MFVLFLLAVVSASNLTDLKTVTEAESTTHIAASTLKMQYSITPVNEDQTKDSNKNTLMKEGFG